MVEIISIHIPKTAGRSLLQIFIQVYGSESVLVVNRKLFKSSPQQAIQDIRSRITSSTKVIHGHVHYHEIKPIIDAFPQCKLITFVRNPADRVISHYFYEKRILSEKGHLSGHKEVTLEDIISYAAHESSRNLISRFLEGATPESLFFSGSFERFHDDVLQLGKLLNWPAFEIPHENNTEEFRDDRTAVTAHERAEIEKLNERDAEWLTTLLHKKPPGSLIKCWIASFPRSGNTYFRNILYYVYGIESGTWHKETAFPVDDDYDQYPFVKTHLLPDELVPDDTRIPAIYLVRDGRDAMVSIAHHKSDLVDPGSDFTENLKEAIVAAEGSYFGGWSKNVNAWLKRAGMIIKYEDLVADPVSVFKRVEKFIELPAADWTKLPAFSEMKSGKPKYGGTTKLHNPKFNRDEFASKFFRKGKAGNWKLEMTETLQEFFYGYHGAMLDRLGYAHQYRSVPQNATLDFTAMQLSGKDITSKSRKQVNILIESSKLLQKHNDGIKRYLVQLLKGFEDVMNNGNPCWNFDLLIGRRIIPLSGYHQLLIPESDNLHDYEKILMGIKSGVKTIFPRKLYEAGSEIYRKTDARKILKKIQQKKTIANELHLHEVFTAAKAKYDLIHIPLPQNASLLNYINHSFVVTVHDITHRKFPQHHEDTNIALSEEGMSFVINKGADAIAVSECTLKDVNNEYNLPLNKLHLVHEAADENLFNENLNRNLLLEIRRRYKLGAGSYLLCLSTLEPRKNLVATVRAFKRLVQENSDLEISLVIAGGHGWKKEALANEMRMDDDRIIFTGYIDENDLSILYSGAEAFCYISLYEGFGLPPLEAMRCGTPVIYGNNSAMNEVVGDAGLGIEAGEEHSIKDAMLKIISDSQLREDLSRKAKHRAFEFSERKMILETLNVYTTIIDRNC